MSKRVKIDYTALQGDSFFKVSKQHIEFLNNQLKSIGLSSERTAGNTAVYGLVAHKRLLKESAEMTSDAHKSFFALYQNTETMLHNLGLKFEQIDEHIASSIKKTEVR